MTKDEHNYMNELTGRIRDILSGFNSISLSELDPCHLMARFDEKFVFHSALIPRILKAANGYYKVLKINNQCLLEYRSLYLDTIDHKMYIDHHNGKGKRYKVRIREYCNTGDQFLEVKDKNNKGEVLKTRIPVENDIYLTPEARSFVEKKTPYKMDNLEPKLSVRFSRTTLASFSKQERITIDCGISYEANGSRSFLPEVGVVEIKKENISENSPIFTILRKMGIHPESFSKYCTGTSQLYPHIKTNNLKPKLAKINNLRNGLNFTNTIS